MQKIEKHRSKYRLKAIEMIIGGYSNTEIYQTLNCHSKYPAQIRREWNKMTKEEQEYWKERIKEARKAAKKEKKVEEEPKVGFHTPNSLARGKYYTSRY